MFGRTQIRKNRQRLREAIQRAEAMTRRLAFEIRALKLAKAANRDQAAELRR